MAHHRMELDVGFKHCDPAGIVFYPRYVEMVNDTVEHWFKHGLGVDFDVLHRVRGVAIPVANLQCEFKRPSRLGEALVATLAVERLGRTSMALAIDFTAAAPGAAGSVTKLSAKLVLVFVDIATVQPIEIPPDLRCSIETARGPAGTAPPMARA